MCRGIEHTCLVSMGRDSGSTALYRKNVRPMTKSGMRPRLTSPEPPMRAPREGSTGGIGGMPHHLRDTCGDIKSGLVSSPAKGKKEV